MTQATYVPRPRHVSRHARIAIPDGDPITSDVVDRG
jgi:hypothetical protein